MILPSKTDALHSLCPIFHNGFYVHLSQRKCWKCHFIIPLFVAMKVDLGMLSHRHESFALCKCYNRRGSVLFRNKNKVYHRTCQQLSAILNFRHCHETMMSFVFSEQRQLIITASFQTFICCSLFCLNDGSAFLSGAYCLPADNRLVQLFQLQMTVQFYRLADNKQVECCPVAVRSASHKLRQIY